jgi:hypothetical protein
MSAAPAPRPVAAEPQEEVETRAGEADIGLPDLPQQEAPPPGREPGRHTGAMKGRHFGPRPVAEPHSAFMPPWRTTPAMREQLLAEIEAAGVSYSSFMRAKFFGVAPTPRDRRPGPDAAWQSQVVSALGRSGNNLNQHLRHMNRYDFSGIPELLEVSKELLAAYAAHHALVAAIKADMGV